MTTPALVFEVLTLFPEAVQSFVRAGLLGKAIEQDLVHVHCTSYRDFASDKHGTVDDAPFGGGAGMVLKPEPVVAAIEHVEAQRGPMHRVLLTPSAPSFDQAAAQRLAALPRVGLVCGRYEGIDDRVREHFVHECLSLGDFVLGGGEVAALAIIEAVSRLHEGVLGNPQSVVHESFTPHRDGAWLEYPQYTRPASFRGIDVPEVLLGGNHGEIERWRRSQARRRTWSLRADLRAHRRLPADLPIYLMIDAGSAEGPDAALLAIARRHAVEGLLLLQADATTVMPWVVAAAGRPSVAAVADRAAVRRRFRRGGGEAPWVVALRESARDSAVPAHSAGELADALAMPAHAQGRALVLWLDPPPDAAGLDAVLVVGGPALATAPAIADVCRPDPRPAALADLALSHLRAAQAHPHNETLR